MGTPDTPPSDRWTLYHLPLAARLTLAAFLISVGIGYFSALVQLHFQHSTPGEIMPTKKNVVEIFHGRVGAPPQSTVERLLTADESKPFTGAGQMRAAFFMKTEDWKETCEERARSSTKKKKVTKEERERASAELKNELIGKQRQGEIDAVVLWVKGGAPESSWKADKFTLPPDNADMPLTPSYAQKDDEGTHVKIRTLLKERCIRCHAKEGEDAGAAKYPLEEFTQWKPYTQVKASSAMSIEKLSQTTHVHLLGFSMLYGLTGLILALTSLPAWIRLPLAPLALVAQVIDISLWWLARLDAPTGPMLAEMIPVTGAIVAAALGLQILLSLFSLFRWFGNVVLVILIAVAIGGGYGLYQRVIDPHLDKERKALEATQAKDVKKDDKGKDQKKGGDAKKDNDKDAAPDKDKGDKNDGVKKDDDGKKDNDKGDKKGD